MSFFGSVSSSASSLASTGATTTTSWGGLLKQAAATLEARVDKVLDISQKDKENAETLARKKKSSSEAYPGQGYVDPDTGIYTAAVGSKSLTETTNTSRDFVPGTSTPTSVNVNRDNSSRSSLERTSVEDLFSGPLSRVLNFSDAQTNSPSTAENSPRNTRSDLAQKSFSLGAAAARKALSFASDTAKVAAAHVPAVTLGTPIGSRLGNRAEDVSVLRKGNSAEQLEAPTLLDPLPFSQVPRASENELAVSVAEVNDTKAVEASVVETEMLSDALIDDRGEPAAPISKPISRNSSQKKLDTTDQTSVIPDFETSPTAYNLMEGTSAGEDGTSPGEGMKEENSSPSNSSDLGAGNQASSLEEPAVHPEANELTLDNLPSNPSPTSIFVEPPSVPARPSDSNIIPDFNTINPVTVTDFGNKTPKESHSQVQIETTSHPAATALKSIVDQRERQLMSSMQENASLNEMVEALRLQIREITNNHSIELRAVRDRCFGLERDLEQVTRERDALSEESQGSGSQNIVQEQLQLLREKDEQIAGLLAEGEKLSKVELKAAQTIKKLRAQEAQNEKNTKELEKRLSDSQNEASNLAAKLTKMLENERKYNESIKTVNEINERQTRDILRLESDLAQTTESRANIQAALEKSWQELREVRRENAESNAMAQSEALEREVKANEELHRSLEVLQKEAQSAEIVARKEIHELRAALSHAEEQAGWKEDNFRNEVSTLQMRLQAAEERNEDLTAGLQDSTRPLLRQIEALQAQNIAALRNWDEVEQGVTQRLHEALAERDAAYEKERIGREKVKSLSSKNTILENQIATERQERARIGAELEMDRQRCERLEQKVAELTAKLDVIKTANARALEDVKESYQRTLRQRIEEEVEAIEERHRAEEGSRLAKEREMEKQRVKNEMGRRQQQDSTHPPPLSASSSRSFTGLAAGSETPGSERFLLSFPYGSGRASVDATNSPSSATFDRHVPAITIERLHAATRQLEGQVSSLNSQLQSVIHSREQLADEMVRMTNQMEELKEKAARLPHLEAQRDELQRRYDAALEMLGERTEQVSELRADIEDLKEALRNQMTRLINH